jgi:uncharacterized protein (DUF4415 family)
MSKQSKSSRTDWERVDALGDDEIDYSETGELDEAFFRQADLRLPPKKPVTLRLDADVLEWFKSQGSGYQTRINKLLRTYMERHRDDSG